MLPIRISSTAGLLAGVAWLTGPVQAQEPKGAAAVTFEYRNETISPEFRNWVAKYGARAPVAYTPKASLEDYVKKVCNNTANANVQLFRQSLTEQGVPIDKESRVGAPKDGVLLLPPCLPVPSTKSVAKLVLPGQRFWDYFAQSGAVPMFKGDAIDSLSPRKLASETSAAGYSMVRYQDATEHAARYLAPTNISGSDTGELALKAFLTANELKQAGVNEVEAKKTVYDSLNAIEPRTATPQLKAGLDAAMRRWSGTQQLSSNEWESVFTATRADAGADFSKQVTWYDPNPARKKDPAALQAGDIVVVPTTAVQSVQIPVDYALLSRSSSTEAADFLKANPPPKPTVESSDNKAGVALLDTQPIDGVRAGACDSATYKQWGTTDFARDFAAAAMRTRILAYRLGVRKFAATVVVVDSGFVQAKEAGAFSEDAFTQVADLLHEQDAPPSLGVKRAHGTIVAGLALGGPQLWGTPPALGIDLRITPATIFDVRMQNAVPTPVFRKQWLLDAIGTTGDIFNISFASRDESQMQAFREYVGKASGKLFVVAAGNNHLNSDVRGVDINDTQLYPQRFGGNDRGPNLIAVAAYDGKGLAEFSNYSDSYVSIAAPGCAIASWAPSEDGSKYEEQKVTGTSFATPIVAHIAAVVKALMPQKFADPKHVRARILASADLTKELKGVEDGRLLNPVKTVSLYEDVIELESAGQRRIVFGKLENRLTINDLCRGVGTPDGEVRLLKFARDPTPEADKDSVVYFMRDGLLDNTKTCKHKPGSQVMKGSNGEDIVIDLDDVVDMVLRVRTHD